VFFIRPHPETNIAVFHAYKHAETSLQECVEQIELDMKRYCGEHVQLVKVHAAHDWPYMPHYHTAELQAGYYSEFQAMQGKNSTYYVGSLFNGELVESCIKYSLDIVRNHFDTVHDPALCTPSFFLGNIAASDSSVVSSDTQQFIESQVVISCNIQGTVATH